MKKVVAVIQARMGSTRFPGKVLMDICGKPMLWHIVYRLRKCRTIDVVAVATSDMPEDDVLAAWCAKENVPVFRGSKENVLQRYAVAVNALNPDVIIRVTGDVPLIDPDTVDRLIDTLLSQKADYSTGEKDIPSIHEGFSPFTRQVFDRLLSEASDDPVAIEHITAYFKLHPESFRIATIQVLPEHQFSGARISVDTPADLKFIEEIYTRLGVPAGEADISEVVKLLRDNPGLLLINKHIYQKKATDSTIKVLIRCDGDVSIGLGHVVRCLALADELREAHGIGVTFAMATGQPGFDMVNKAGFPLRTLPEDTSETEWLENLMGETKINALILDIRNNLPREKIRKWRRDGLFIVVIDDPSDRRLEADLAFCPSVPQVKEMDWSGFTGKRYVGWEWVILRKQFAEVRLKTKEENKLQRKKQPNILVTMGGSDPAELTLKTIRALSRVRYPFHAMIILGQSYMHRDELDKLLKESSFSYSIHNSVDNMAELMQQADFAIASFGVTAYELAAMGIPGIFLSLTEDHAQSANIFERENMGINMGVYTNVSEDDIAEKVNLLLNKKELIGQFCASCNKKIDGLGAKRVASLIVERMKTKIGYKK